MVRQPFSLLAERRHYGVGYGPVSLSSADFDADGDAEVVVANAGSYDGVNTITVFRDFTRALSGVADKGPGGHAATMSHAE